jgi:hypothetical protein
VLCRVARWSWNGLSQNPTHPRPLRWGKRDWYGLGTSLVLFRLVVPPLQPGEVDPYPVRAVWFASRLPLKGTTPTSFLKDDAFFLDLFWIGCFFSHNSIFLLPVLLLFVLQFLLTCMVTSIRRNYTSSMH